MYALSTISVNGTATPAISINNDFWALEDVAPELLKSGRGLLSVFEQWDVAEKRLAEIADKLTSGSLNATKLKAPATDDFLTPIQYPNKLVLVGANYYDHMRLDAKREDFGKDTYVPCFFLKPPSTSLVGPGKTVRYPIQSEKLDYEIELAAVIGKRAKRLTLENAMEVIAGYTIAIDFSARDWQKHPKHIVKFDLFGGKCFDDSCPVGPVVVPAGALDPENLTLKLWVNGELRQDSNTNGMIWSLAEQLVLISEHLTLEPGDIISTGTPAGCALRFGSYLKIGDVIEAEIQSIGKLSVELIEE